MPLPFALALLALAGCESMIRYDLTVEVPASVQQRFAALSPGVLLLGSSTLGDDGALEAQALALLCDPQDESLVVDASTDWAFGCADELANWKVEAWIVPLPVAWKDLATCGKTFAWDPETEPLGKPELYAEGMPYDSGTLFDGDDYHSTDICGGEDSLALVLQ
jgi:hypothetical protein